MLIGLMSQDQSRW